MARRTLLLDLDGTLWDSRPWYAGLLARLSGNPVAGLKTRLAKGTSVVRLAAEQGVSKARLMREAKQNSASLAFYDGVRETLDKLGDRGTLMGVVTNLPGWLVRPVAEATGIAEYFESVVTPRPGVPAKPRPNGIRKALKEMKQGVGAHIWFVGDDATDGKAAAAGGVRFAWASYGYETETPPATETVLERFEDVLEL